MIKVVGMLHRVDWAGKVLYIIQILLNYIKLVVPVYLVDRIIQFLQVFYLLFHIPEDMLVFYSIHWTNQILQG